MENQNISLEKPKRSFWRIIGRFFIYLILFALFLLIVDIIYGKIQYSKIPEIDESMFQRSEHQTPLPDNEDALIQLKKLDESRTNSDLWHNIEKAYFSVIAYQNNIFYKNSKIWWEYNQDECILIYSWDNAYCGTWSRNKNTLTRFLDSYLPELEDENVTVREYIDANEDEIKSDLQELDKVLSMDYYLPNDKILQLLPQFLQWYTRSSMILLIYYTDKWDWDMVDYIIKLNYKSVDILNHIWSMISVLISAVLQDYVDDTINSTMQIFPEDLRLRLAKFYEENMRNKDDIIHEMAKWEYVMWNELRETELKEDYSWILTLYPIYSKKDTKRLMLYAYSLLYNNDSEWWDNLWDTIFEKLRYSVYNIWWVIEAEALLPRLQSYNIRIGWNLWHKQALIENLKSGEYKIWFNEKQWNDNPDYYEFYRIPTEDELNE